MEIIYNLIIILIIIGFSYLFESSCKYEYNIQLTFILLSLFIVIIYKFLINKCIMTEHFNDFKSQIDDFLRKDPPSDKRQSTEEYKQELTKLSDKVDIMNEYLGEIKATAERAESGDVIGNQLNIQASQQIQDYRIREMQKEIASTTDLIKEAKMREDATKYKKIPIYSSCVVSNADGSMQTDDPTMMNNSNVSQRNIVSGLISQRDTNNLRGVNNIGDDKPIMDPQKEPLVNGSSKQIGEFIKNILEKGVNVNINT